MIYGRKKILCLNVIGYFFVKEFLFDFNFIIMRNCLCIIGESLFFFKVVIKVNLV